jgi:hypothetical protein
VANDRSVRFLSALGGASTSRVLNLYRIAADHAGDPERAEKPLFLSPVINRAFLLKHRTRSDESYLFPSPKAVATKIIIPFDPSDLKAGGRSLFVDQRGYCDMLRSAGNYSSDALDRDLWVCACSTQCRHWTPSCCANTCATTISKSPPAISPFPTATRRACMILSARRCPSSSCWRVAETNPATGWSRPCCPTRSMKSWSRCA